MFEIELKSRDPFRPAVNLDSSETIKQVTSYNGEFAVLTSTHRYSLLLIHL